MRTGSVPGVIFAVGAPQGEEPQAGVVSLTIDPALSLNVRRRSSDRSRTVDITVNRNTRVFVNKVET